MFESLEIATVFLTVIFGSIIYLILLGVRRNSPGNLLKTTIFDNWLSNFNIRNRRWRIPQLCEYISRKYGKVVELSLLGQRVVVVTDHKIANAFMTKHTKHLRQRFGNEDGLKKLNMHNNGLIWNNDTLNWKNNRIIFEATLNNGIKLLDELSRTYFETQFVPSITLAKPNSLLTLLRNYTVTMTMEGLFGLELCKNFSFRDKAKETVANYFKAWEFFLLTPNTHRFGPDEKEHEKYCKDMASLSKEIFDSSHSVEKPSKFIEDLSEHNTEIQICQCITEMLLAGTDTSSLTMFYTTLFLADHPEVGNELAKTQITEQNIAELYYESMRLISVGPVILRQAEAECTLSIDGLDIILSKGDGIIFNIAGMNLDSSKFPEPKSFNPSRYSDDHNQHFPLTFGIGKKSCVGKNFAEKEMKLFFTWFIQKYVLLGTGESMISLLQTRWDIANAPMSDIHMYVFPRIIVYLLGNVELITDVVKQLKNLLPRIKVVDGREEKVDLECLCLAGEFAIVYGISMENYNSVQVGKNSLAIYVTDGKGDENEHLIGKELGAKFCILKLQNKNNNDILQDVLNLIGNQN